jgi:hypothetical protein
MLLSSVALLQSAHKKQDFKFFIITRWNKVIKIKKYSIVIIQMYFVALMMPFVVILAYAPDRADDWSLLEYILIVLLGFSIFATIIVIASKKQIVFSNSKIIMYEYKKVIALYKWDQVKRINVDYDLYIRKYTFKFDNDAEYSFEATKSKMNQVISLCPFGRLKNDIETVITK